MKVILFKWLCQTLLILMLKHVIICRANDPLESHNLARSNYEDRSLNRAGYGEPENIRRSKDIYDAAYANRARLLRQQDYIGRVGGQSKFTKLVNLRKFNPDNEHNLRNGYLTVPGYGNTRNGDSKENTDIAATGESSVEEDTPNISEVGNANNTLSIKSSLVKPNANSCPCESSGASDEVSSLCFNSKDGSKNFSINYKGIIKFSLEDIIKAYKFYLNNINALNVDFENIINGESNLKHVFDGDNKFNIDLGKFKFFEGNFNYDADSNKFFTNEMSKGSNKVKVNDFSKFDLNSFKKHFNKFDLDINKYFDSNSKFDKKNNGNYNFEGKLESLKKGLIGSESNKNSNFFINSDLNANQYFDSDMQDYSQAEIEAQAKALLQAKAIATAQAILQAQAQADAKAQSIIQKQIIAQAQADQISQAQSQINSQFKVQSQGQAQAQSQAKALAQVQANVQGNTQAFGLETAQAFGQGISAFSQGNAQASGQGISAFGQGNAQAFGQENAQTFGQGIAQALGQGNALTFGLGNSQAFGQENSQVFGQGNTQAFGQSDNSQDQGHGFNFDLNYNTRPKKAKKKIIGSGGYSSGFQNAFGGKYSTSFGNQIGGSWMSGSGGTKAAISGISINSRLPFAASSSVGNVGLSPSAAAAGAYQGEEMNYADSLYDDSADDSYSWDGYPGVLALPAPADSPITGGRFHVDDRNQKNVGLTPYGGSGYNRYP